jgi:hypothetical protein
MFPIFYLQLYAIARGINPRFAFYCVRSQLQVKIFKPLLMFVNRQQIAIMNATSILGCVLPGLITRKYGTMNLLIIFSLCMGATIFCLGIVKNAAGMAIFSSVYGIFLGACKSQSYCFSAHMFTVGISSYWSNTANARSVRQCT